MMMMMMMMMKPEPFLPRGENLSNINETYDVIVAAEVVYDEQYAPLQICRQLTHVKFTLASSFLRLFGPLIETIVALSGFNTILLLAHTERRSKEGKALFLWLFTSFFPFLAHHALQVSSSSNWENILNRQSCTGSPLLCPVPNLKPQPLHQISFP